MRKLFKVISIIFVYILIVSCAGKPVDDGEMDDSSGSSEIDMHSASSTDGVTESTDTSASPSDDPESLEKDLEKEQKVAEGGDPLLEEDPLLDSSKKDQQTNDPQSHLEPQVSEQSITQQEPPPVVAEEKHDPLLDSPPPEATPAITSPTANEDLTPQASTSSSPSTDISSSHAEIRNIRFEANEGGGSVIIEGTENLDFSGRFNPQSHQYIVEIRNAKLPNSLKRPFITKDFQSVVGSVDAFQDPTSDVVKVVVQLREGASEPMTHAEGKSIIVVPSGVGTAPESTNVAAEGDSSSDSFSNELNGGKGILSSNNLGQFLSGNLKYYGKKISIEVKDIEVRNAINLIADESGANLVMSEGVSGNLALKLRNVPWDQALVLILKAKKLGYTRQGNVLRISPLSEIKQEEEDAMKLAESRKKIEPLKVQMIPINYAKISDLQGQIKTVISERGSIVADTRTNALIITETAEVLDRAKKIIASLDVAPAQVLIEGKLVEARESFDRKIGINWDIAGQPSAVGSAGANMTPNLSIRPSQLGSASLGFNLTLGTLDVLGDLSSVLQLEEKEENVKVISSPRIVTLHNEQASITQAATISVLASQSTSADMKVVNRTYKDLTMKMELNVTPEVANNGVVQLKVDITREFVGAIRDDGTASPHSRSAKTKVMVKSGQTAVIGGIYQNDGSQLETGVPLLKDIPILGYLFRGKTFHKDKTELLLFLTPRVLSQAGSSVIGDGISTNSFNNNSTSSLE